jgi:hypothetical protein
MVATGNLLWNNEGAFDGCEVLCLVTIDVVLDMATTRQLHIVDCNHTPATILSTSCLLAKMLARVMDPFTRLRTSKDFVHALRMATCETLMTTIAEALMAGQLAATFRAESQKVLGLEDLNDCSRMSRATFHISTLE